MIFISAWALTLSVRRVQIGTYKNKSNHETINVILIR